MEFLPENHRGKPSKHHGRNQSVYVSGGKIQWGNSMETIFCEFAMKILS